MKTYLGDYVNATGYLRNMRLVTDKLVDPELNVWMRTERNDLADVAAILAPALDGMGI